MTFSLPTRRDATRQEVLTLVGTNTTAWRFAHEIIDVDGVPMAMYHGELHEVTGNAYEFEDGTTSIKIDTYPVKRI